MTINSEQFLSFVFKHKALLFGAFTLKSGRQSPYFFNSGALQSGNSLLQFTTFYAQYLLAHNLLPDILLGPAYKGIPLSVGAACVLAQLGHDVGYCFNRKEPKNHGEGGMFVGQAPSNDMVILDDVITAGTALSALLTQLEQINIRPKAVLVAIDRAERTANGVVASDFIKTRFGVPVHSLITVDKLLTYGKNHQLLSAFQYREALRYFSGNSHSSTRV